MMKKLVCMSMIVLMANCAFGMWSDDFETQGDPLTAPWLDGPVGTYRSDLGAYAGIGYEGSVGVLGYMGGGWSTGQRYRPTDAGDTVIGGKLYTSSSTSYSNADVVITGDAVTTVDWDDSWYVRANLYSLGIGAADTLRFDVWDEVTAANETINVGGLSEDVWYTTRLTVNVATISCEYKQSDSATWINAGDLTKPTNFAANYVMIRAMRDGYMDDVSSTPEPATMLLLGLGGLLIRRKK